MSKSTKEIFEDMADTGEWPSRYDTSNVDNYNFIARRDSVRQIVKGNTFASVLDLGCGTGDYCELLSAVSAEYVGVDFSSRMIRKASLDYGGSASRPTFLEGSADALPFDENRFDLVCAIGFIEYFADPDVPMREIVRVLRPGGTLVIQSFQVDLFRNVSSLLGMDAVKRVVRPLLGRRSVAFDTNKPYSQDELDRLMKEFQFKKQAHLYSNYHVLPRTLRRVFGAANVYCSELLTKRQPPLFRSFAVNYLGRYTLLTKS